MTNNQGNIVILIYREGIRKYPSNFELQTYLAAAICVDFEKDSREAGEVINICRRILTTALTTPSAAVPLYIVLYLLPQLDDVEKAVEIVNLLPGIFECKEYASAMTLKIRYLQRMQKNIFFPCFVMLLTQPPGNGFLTIKGYG